MFTKDIQEFTMSLDALRDYNNYIEPIVLDNLKKKYENEFKEMECIKETFQKLEELSNNASETEIKAVINEVKDLFKGEITATFDEDADGWSISTSEEDSERLNNAATNISSFNKQMELMYKSTLINLVSNVECFFGDILHQYFSSYSGEVVGKLIESKDKIYTINELEEFDSIEEAKNYIIDKKIENLIRGSFSDWLNFLKCKMQISMGYLTDDISLLKEIFQRRNLFIHNKGIINRIYISNVKENIRYSSNIGEKIILNKEYLENSINLLENSFTLIAFEIWKKRNKDDDYRGYILTKLSEKYLNQERWGLLENINTFILNDGATLQVFSLQAQINLWLAKKRLGKINKDEISKKDFSGYEIDFRICQAALLDDYDRTFKLLERALDTNQISGEILYNWPVFNEFRESSQFQDLINQRNITEPIKKNLIYPQINLEDEEENECEKLKQLSLFDI